MCEMISISQWGMFKVPPKRRKEDVPIKIIKYKTRPMSPLWNLKT